MTMKAIIVLAFLVAAARSAAVERIDWSKVKPIYAFPSFWDKYPQLQRPTDLGTGRIVGGQEATPHKFPYQVGVLMNVGISGVGYCGGSLISQRFVLTAAHCLDIRNVRSFTLVFGAHDITNENESSQVRITTTDIIIHRLWNPDTLMNDIALIHLPEPVELTEYIKVIRLPSFSQTDVTFVDELSTVAGWGIPSDSSNVISPVLRYVRQPVITNRVCNVWFFNSIWPSHICMSGSNGRNTCSGDSGGPLTVTESDGISTQVGVVSFGIALGCERGWPSVFARVTSYLDWIEVNSDIRIRP